MNWTWILGFNKIQRQVLQEGHGDVPKVGDRVGGHSEVPSWPVGCPGERIRLLDSWMIPWKNGL